MLLTQMRSMAFVLVMGRTKLFLMGLKFTIVMDCSAIVLLYTWKSAKPQVARCFEQLNMITQLSIDQIHK